MRVLAMALLLAVSSACLAVPAATADPYHGDYRALSFAASFDSLFFKFSTVYPFTAWKAIDWQGLYDEFAPQVAAAGSAQDTSAYKLAIRRFLHRFPDGHVRIKGDFGGLYGPEIGGGLGLTLVELDDGSFAVNRVLPGGPAAQVGIQIGATVSEWNGGPVLDALRNADLVWEGKPPATQEAVRLAQLRRLVRLPVGAPASVTFANPGGAPETAVLTAVDDGLATWELTRFSKFDSDGNLILAPDDVLAPVESAILPSGYGYLKCRILVEFDAQGHVLPTYDGIVAQIEDAIDSFNDSQVRGVIIDVRDNPGGYDRLAAVVAGFFYDHTELYEQAAFYLPQTGQFEVIESFSIDIEPQASHYGGRVVCLVDEGTASSAEGVAMAVQRRPRGHVLGFRGSSGSFGLTSGESLLPGGLSISYPLGRSLDAGDNIQLDSDATLQGGVEPDVRVPMTRANMLAMFVDAEDVELAEAIAYLNEHASVDDDGGDDEGSGAVSHLPAALAISAVAPNPFNPRTTVWLDLPQPSRVALKVVDPRGALVNTLWSGWLSAGRHPFAWDGADASGWPAASGVYLFRLEAADGSVRTAKATLWK